MRRRWLRLKEEVNPFEREPECVNVALSKRKPQIRFHDRCNLPEVSICVHADRIKEKNIPTALFIWPSFDKTQCFFYLNQQHPQLESAHNRFYQKLCQAKRLQRQQPR